MRAGADQKLGRFTEEDGGRNRHTYLTVYREMLLEICGHYRCLPDPRTLSASEIRFFFEGMRSTLHVLTKPRA